MAKEEQERYLRESLAWTVLYQSKEDTPATDRYHCNQSDSNQISNAMMYLQSVV